MERVKTLVIVNYHRPHTVDEALSLAASPDAVILAGGTVVNADRSAVHGDVVDLQALDIVGIEGVSGGVRIGAITTLGDIVTSELAPELIRDLAHREAPNTVRNAATIGGTIGARDPESQLLTGLLAFGAKVSVVHPDITAEHPIEALLEDPGLLDRSLITHVTIPSGGMAAASRTGRTPLDVPIVLAVAHRTSSGALTIAASGVSDRPVVVDPAHLDDLEPPDDFRGSSDYRKAIAGVLVDRVIASVDGGGR
ncbi:MAG: FAD binding domain-containing protein [Acidimicrobiia bacterium]